MAGWPRKVISKEKFSGKWPSGWAEGIGQLKWPSSASLRGGPQASYSSSPGKSSRVGMPSVLAWPTLNARSPSGVLWGQKPGPSGTPACPPRTPRAFRTSTGSAAERSRGGQRWGTARTSPGLQDGGSGFFWGGGSASPSLTPCVCGSGRRSRPGPPALPASSSPHRCSDLSSLLTLFLFPLGFW